MAYIYIFLRVLRDLYKLLSKWYFQQVFIHRLVRVTREKRCLWLRGGFQLNKNRLTSESVWLDSKVKAHQLRVHDIQCRLHGKDSPVELGHCGCKTFGQLEHRERDQFSRVWLSKWVSCHVRAAWAAWAWTTDTERQTHLENMFLSRRAQKAVQETVQGLSPSVSSVNDIPMLLIGHEQS